LSTSDATASTSAPQISSAASSEATERARDKIFLCVPGFWQSVTGSLEEGEAPRDAAIREVGEETGLDAAGIEDWQTSNVYEIYPHWRHRYAPGVTQNTEHIFGLILPQPQPVTLAPAEHVRYEWVDWREAAKRVFSWTNVAAIECLPEMARKE